MVNSEAQARAIRPAMACHGGCVGLRATTCILILLDKGACSPVNIEPDLAHVESCSKLAMPATSASKPSAPGPTGAWPASMSLAAHSKSRASYCT